jgi:hypothetical protein
MQLAVQQRHADDIARGHRSVIIAAQVGGDHQANPAGRPAGVVF